jgi:hypothetical protein
MSDHQPHSEPAHEQRVRERAYLLWEAAGKPEGRDLEFWDGAQTELAEEDRAAMAPPALTAATGFAEPPAPTLAPPARTSARRQVKKPA